MKKIFVKTENVKKFIAFVKSIQNTPLGVPRIGLIYGEPGLGKSQTALWWALKEDAAYIRCANMMTCRWFLEELAEELGEVPYFRASDIFKQCVKQLKEKPRLIIVDEIDYLVSDNMAIETLRDIHDKTDVPIILIGMNKVDKKLLRHSHLYDRISKKLKFIPFSENDVTQIVKQLCEIEITEDAAKYIYSQANRLRQIVKIINTAENFCMTNGLKIIDEKILQEVIKNETEIIKTC